MAFSSCLRRSVGPLLLLASLARCGGGDLVLPSGAGPAAIAKVHGDAQSGTAGMALADSVVVRVTDAQDRAVVGQGVVFTPSGGAGDASPQTVETGEDGMAAASWVLGPSAGSQALEARVAGTGEAAGLTVQFTASAVPGAAHTIAAFSGDGQTAAVGTALSDSLVTLVTDQMGNPVAGVTVDWQVTSGSVSPASVTTGPDGHAAARRVLGSEAQDQFATATSSGLQGSPVTFTHHAVPGTASSLVLISGDGQTAAPGEVLPDPLVVRLVDASGNGIPDQAVAWVLGPDQGSVSPESSQTDGDGLASARWTLGSTEGDYTLDAVVSGVGLVEFTASAMQGGTPSAGRSKVEASPQSIQAGSGTSTIKVTVLDQGGDPVKGATVTLAATGSGNDLVQPDKATDAKGVTSGSLQSSVAETKTVSATVNGNVKITQTAQVIVTAAPAQPDHMVFLVQPSTTGRDENITPPVEVALVDAGGSILPLSGVQISMELADGADSRLRGSKKEDTVAGVAAFSSLRIDHQGTYRLRASAPANLGLDPVDSDPFEVTH